MKFQADAADPSMQLEMRLCELNACICTGMKLLIGRFSKE